MKIGKLTLETVALDESRLFSSTGHSAAEMRRVLSGPASSTTIAKALNACLEPQRHVAELAREIAADPEARLAVASLYEPKEARRGRKGRG
jgi:hypothetical protein